jgi:hypothetical protein
VSFSERSTTGSRWMRQIHCCCSHVGGARLFAADLHVLTSLTRPDMHDLTKIGHEISEFSPSAVAGFCFGLAHVRRASVTGWMASF